MRTERFFLEHESTPLGELLIVTDEAQRLRAVDWCDFEGRMRDLFRRQYPDTAIGLERRHLPSQAAEAMRDYFAGHLTAVESLITTTGGTEFQRQVWSALRKIPCGGTLTYSALAMQLGKPLAVRAVGMANGANPIGIIVPCHRVVGARGALTGYGGGLWRKQWLLAHEKQWTS